MQLGRLHDFSTINWSKMLTRGRGVKNPKNLADVICERPLTYLPRVPSIVLALDKRIVLFKRLPLSEVNPTETEPDRGVERVSGALGQSGTIASNKII